MDNAIYFPYINVPRNRWFTRVLLYWNHVSSIVPMHYIDSPSTLGNYMYDLVQEGLVRQIAPADHIHKIEPFMERFLEYVKSPSYLIPPDIKSRQALPKTKIHIEKMQFIADELIEMGLAKPSPRPREYPWFEVESKTANLFMAYLASSLGNLSEFKCEPITSNLMDFKAIARMSHQERIISQICKNRTFILDSVLPAPDITLRPIEIAEFKEEYGRGLTEFRNKLEYELNQVTAIEDPFLQKRQIEQIILNMEYEKNEIRELMKARGWRTTSSQLLFCIPPVLSLLLAFQRGDVPEQCIEAASTMIASYGLLKNLRVEDNLGYNYAFYAVLAERRWPQSKNNNEIVIGEEL